MKLLRGLTHLRAEDPDRGCVVTIGNFDGVHRGHQAMLERLRAHARRLELPALVLTFEPMPREFMDPMRAPARLTRLREKVALFAADGIDRCIVLKFDAALRQLRGAEFIDLLSRALDARVIVVGHDFRFAYKGEADVASLQAAGATLGFAVDTVAPVMVDGERVSSSAVRAALARGELALAAKLLGRPYAMCGRVVKGQQLGRTLGFPTANLRLHRKFSPLDGIFAVRVHGAGQAGALPGVASLGIRPTVGGAEPLLEAHAFDFDGDLYGRYLQVEFVARLRAERKFATLNELVEQMNEDARQARRALEVTGT